MATIQIKTPKGVVEATIAGDTISEDELVKLKRMFPSDDESFEYETLSSGQVTEEEVTEEETPELEPIEGEVEDNWLRFNTGRADTSDERQKVLNAYLGEGTSEQVGDDIFVIDQAKVAPEIRKKFGLADEGKIYLDKPGFTGKDVMDFLGEAGPATAAAIGSGLMVTGIGIVPGALIVGGAAALAKAADEAIEYAQGRNLQSAGDVGSSIVTEGALNAVFQGAGGLIAKGAGRVFRGAGPDPSAARIDELIAQGFPEKNLLGMKMQKADRFPYFDTQPTAREIALEEGRAAMQQIINYGAKPGLKEAAGKNLAARALSVTEAITGSTKVGEANARFIKGLVDDVSKGTKTEDEVIQALKSEENAIAAVIKEQLADPDQALVASQNFLDKVVKTEIKRWIQAFDPAKGIPKDFIEANKRVAELFKLEGQNNFSIARNTLGDKAVFSIAPLKAIIRDLQRKNKYGDFSGKFFDVIKGMDSASLDDLQSLKNLLQMTIKTQDEKIVATTAQGEIKALLKGIDTVLGDNYADLSLRFALKGGVGKPRYRKNLDTGELVLLNPEEMVFRKYGPTELAQLRKGLEQWDEAKRLWGEGIEQFNNQALNNLVKSFDAKYFNSNRDVMKVAIENGDSAKLSMYLNAVTPPLKAAAKLTTPDARLVLQRARELVAGDQFKAAAELIEQSGFEGVIPKVYPWMSKLPSDDAFRIIQKEGYLKEIDRLSTISEFAANPQVVRNSIRNGLAKEWVTDAQTASLDEFGQFSPPLFAKKFTALTERLQDTLFGADNAKVMREAMDGFRLLGFANKKETDKLFQALPTLVNQPIKESVSILKNISDQAVRESQDAVFAAIKGGTIKNNQDLVAGLIASPESYKRLLAIKGPEFMEAPGGVKDLIVENLFKNTFPDTRLTEATIQSGDWGNALAKAISKQNREGALDAILGTDVVKGFKSIAENAIRVSDMEMKGKGQLVAAAASMTIITAASLGHVWEAAVAYGGSWAFSRLMRSTNILKILTNPGIRKQQYDAAIRAGANLPPFKEWNASTIAQLVAQEASIVMGADYRATLQEGAKVATAAQDDFREQLSKLGMKSDTRRADTSLAPLPSAIDFSQPAPVQPAPDSRGGIPTLAPNIDKLRRIEMEKLLGTQ